MSHYASFKFGWDIRAFRMSGCGYVSTFIVPFGEYVRAQVTPSGEGRGSVSCAFPSFVACWRRACRRGRRRVFHAAGLLRR